MSGGFCGGIVVLGLCEQIHVEAAFVIGAHYYDRVYACNSDGGK